MASNASSSAPAELSDSTHHGGWLIIITAVCLATTILCLCIRAFVRVVYGAITGLPDYVFALAGLIGIVHSCLVFWEASYGLGTAISLVPTSHVETLQKAWFSSDVLYLLVIYLSKCCACLVYLQLTPAKNHNRACLGLLCLATAWVLVSILVVGVNCELNPPWADLAGHCKGLLGRWAFVLAFDVFIEVLLFALSIYLVIGLQMPNKRKVIIVVAFGSRLFVIIPAGFRFHYLTHQIISLNPTLNVASTAIWTSLELHGSIVACITYCFKSFAAAVSTNYGGVQINVEVYDTTNKRMGYGTSSNKSRKGSTMLPYSGGTGFSRTIVTAPGGGGTRRLKSQESDDSQKVIITTEVTVDHRSLSGYGSRTESAGTKDADGIELAEQQGRAL